MDAPKRNQVGLALEHGFRLEALCIEPATGEVSGAGGREMLDPKVMGVLLLLAERAGHVVSRDELYEHLWPGAVVTDDALTRCIHALRRQLSQAGGDERHRAMIETLPKRGYRLNGTVLPLDPVPEPVTTARSRRLPFAAAALIVVAVAVFAILSRDGDRVAPALANKVSIAVLPFVDMSEARDQGYLGDGIAEEILNSLAKSGDMRVIARTSSFTFRDGNQDIAEIAEKLGVSHVLEGSVRRSGDRIRITAQLIGAHDSSHLWSATYDRAFGELIATQHEIANAIATALQITLVGNATQERLPASATAYEKFLRGKFLYDRRAPGDIARAATYFEQAVAADPGYARAWAALSGAYALMTDSGEMPVASGRARQKEAALRAVALGPGLAEAHARLARYYFEVDDHERGREHRLRAEALDPEDPLVLGGRAGIATSRRDFPEAIAIGRKLVARDPLSAIMRNNLAVDLAAAGFRDEAIREFETLRELNPDVAPERERLLTQLYLLTGRADEAYAVIRRMPEGAERDRALALFHRVPGREAEAQKAFERVASSPGRDRNVALAEAQAFRGQRDLALESLARALSMIKSNAHLPPDEARQFYLDMRTSPILTPLHGDPRFEAILADKIPAHSAGES